MNLAEPQIIHTAAGEELVVLPRAAYEALVARVDAAKEDDEDVALYDARKAEAVALPAEVSAAMLRGDSLLRALRRWRGLSQVAMARQAGLTQGYISDLEQKRRAGTANTIETLAKVLDVPAAWLK